MFDDLGWPHGGSKWKVSNLPKLFQFVLRGTWMSANYSSAIHSVITELLYFFLPQMSTSCCHRRKSPREDRPSHQALSCGDNERLLQSIKGLLRNFRSDQSRWSATTIGLRWAALPHRGLNPRELTKDARGRCAAATQEVPDSYDGRESPFGAINHTREIHFFCDYFLPLWFHHRKRKFQNFCKRKKRHKANCNFFFFIQWETGDP